MHTNEERQLLLATSCDDRYLWPWACSLFSAVRSAKTPSRFLLANVNGLLSQGGKQLATDFLAFLQVDGEIVDITLAVGAEQKYDWNATVYARLALLDLLDERFVWLDSDTILSTGWTEIFTEADNLMQDSSIIACGVLDRTSTLDELRESGTNTAFEATKGDYFNAGILCVDPLRWRAAGMDGLWRELVATQSERGFNYQDQDVLNFLLAGRSGFLSQNFNHIVSEPTNGSESILHFAGFPKPWRLSEQGRAFFIATEALNYDRPKDQVSGGGQAWKLFPKYWEVERSLTEALEAKRDLNLLTGFRRLRESQLLAPSAQQKIKFWGLRLLSKKLLPH